MIKLSRGVARYFSYESGCKINFHEFSSGFIQKINKKLGKDSKLTVSISGAGTSGPSEGP